MNSVYILQHVHIPHDDCEDVKFIGVYSTQKMAQQAIERLKAQPGFKETPQGFYIEEYDVDVDHWCEGFITHMHPHD